MKLEPESLYNSQRSSNEHDTKGTMINTENPFIHAAENHFVIDVENKEKQVLSSANGRKKDTDKCQEDFIDVENGDDRRLETFHSAQAHEFELAFKEDYYSDKVVMKEDFYDCNTVKDIIVDEGAQSPIKAGNEEMDTVASSMCNLYLENGPGDLTKEIAYSSTLDDTNVDKEQSGLALVSHDNSSEEINVVKNNASVLPDNSGNVEVKHKFSEGDASASLVNNESKQDQIESRLADENNSSLSLDESQTMLNTNESGGLIDPFSDLGKSTKDLSDMDSSSLVFSDEELISADKQKDQGKLEECDSAFTTLAELIKAGEAPINEDKSSRVISFRFDEAAATTSGRSEIEEIKDNQQTEPERKGTDSASTSARCSFRHLIQKDPNSMEPDMMSGPIVNSGHIPYSGNISFRSESSATSARSFAFPILQSEWNSSPVKMKKAKRRPRGWRMGLVCCRF